MKFSEYPYSRPDMDAVKKELKELTSALKAAQTFDEADGLFQREQEIYAHVATLSVLSTIRHDIDTRDGFYDKEHEFFNSALPELMEYMQLWNFAMVSSPFRPEFERKYDRVFLLNAEMSLKAFSPEIIGEMQRENALTAEYSKLYASACIPFEGKTYTIAQMGPFQQDPDDKRRLAAWKAVGQWFEDNQPRLNGIYDELVQLRDTMGKKLGGDSFVELGYRRMNRNCYDRHDIEVFRSAVQKYVVPVADSVYRQQAKRLGVAYPMSFADAALMFRSGNPRPRGSADDILSNAREFYHALSPETGEFIDVMLDNGLMDVLAKEGKAGGGYCEGLYEYGVPFIFANFNGTSDDVETVTHEAGHAFEAWTCRNIRPYESAFPSMEGCEVHSMSMEYFAWLWADRFYGEDAGKFRYSHLASGLTFIPYGTMVDHFQHIAYDHPEYTPEQRHEAWRELMGVYMPWIRLDGEIPFFSDGKHWQAKHHIYELPFYYIDYCLASAVALQFWAMIQEDREKAWQTYMAYTAPGGTKTFRELLEGAGLMSPFGDECLKSVCGKVGRWLEDYDLSGII